MKQPKHVELLRAIVRSSGYLSETNKGGAHTEVLRIDPEKLTENLAALGHPQVEGPFRRELQQMAEEISERFLLKKGKTRDFSMQLVGSKENVIPRGLISYAFGPNGYNLLPTVEKVLMDSSEASREVPYFSAGIRGKVLAPDLLGKLQKAYRLKRRPANFLEPEDDLFMGFLDEGEERNLKLSIYDVLTRDVYFKGNVANWKDLKSYQEFVRSNPLTREMEESLSQFFDAPITVGIRDTLRWTLGSRHPEMNWDEARRTIMEAFHRHGHESFLPVEVTYYASDMEIPDREIQIILEINARVVPRFAQSLQGAMIGAGLRGLDRKELENVAQEILEFHHGYPIFEIEPYQGVLSVSSLRMLVRLSMALAALAVGLDAPEQRNVKLDELAKRPGTLIAVVNQMDESERERLFAAIQQALEGYIKTGGVEDELGTIWTYRRAPKTFYSFQENASYQASQKGTVEEVITLEDLHREPYKQMLTEVPELSEKLTVFFTLIYRYFRDTGFVPDLRPRNAGRDIFVLGIWGYVSDNLLVVIWRDENGNKRTDLSFVDNKDQFKEYRRSEDRRLPVGLAKNAVRLTGPLIEPAMLRSIGLFSNQCYVNQRGEQSARTDNNHSLASKSVDVVQEVIHSAIDYTFGSAKTVTEDVVDDVFAGVKRILKKK